jgi:hypothetical protein
MRAPSGTGPPGIQVQRDFEGNRLAKDSQTRAYQKVLPVVRRSESQTGGTGQLGRDVDASLVGQEEVAA